jgi:hypothetical protein
MEQQQQYHQGGQAFYPPQEKPAGYADPYGQQYPQQYHNTNSAAVAQSQYHNGYTGPNTGQAQTSTGGTKRGALVGFIITIVVLLAAIIGLAAGLGVSQNSLHSAKSDLSAAQASL